MTQTITVTNVGTAPLEVSAVTTNDPLHFPATNGCTTLAPSASCTVMCRSHRRRSGSETPATLTVASNAPGAAATVALDGTSGRSGGDGGTGDVAFGAVETGTASAQDNHGEQHRDRTTDGDKGITLSKATRTRRCSQRHPPVAEHTCSRSCVHRRGHFPSYEPWAQNRPVQYQPQRRQYSIGVDREPERNRRPAAASPPAGRCAGGYRDDRPDVECSDVLDRAILECSDVAGRQDIRAGGAVPVVGYPW